MAYTLFPKTTAEIIKNCSKSPDKAGDIVELFSFLKKKFKQVAENVTDAVMQLYFSKNGVITKNGKPDKEKNEFTLLAGFVVEEMDGNGFVCGKVNTSSSFRCVALGTGTKCIPNAKRRKDGCVLCDSHAEVVARRALVKWMHEEISKASTSTVVSPQKSVFVREAQTEMFRLKENVKLHFFISQPPCGDASVFKAKEKEEEKYEASVNGRLNMVVNVPELTSTPVEVPVKSQVPFDLIPGTVLSSVRHTLRILLFPLTLRRSTNVSFELS